MRIVLGDGQAGRWSVRERSRTPVVQAIEQQLKKRKILISAEGPLGNTSLKWGAYHEINEIAGCRDSEMPFDECTNDDWLMWIAVGAISGLALSAVGTLVLIIHGDGVLQQYQALIGACIALLGAIVTVLTLRRQITQSDRHEHDRRVRRNYAVRALMPAALSAICEYAQECTGWLKVVQPPPGTTESKEIELSEDEVTSLPGLPTNHLTVLGDCIETADSNSANAIADLISKLQIQQSRLVYVRAALIGGSSTPSIITTSTIDDRIVDALECHALASGLFAYARRKENCVQGQVNRGNIINSAMICGIRDTDYPNAFRLFDSVGTSYI